MFLSSIFLNQLITAVVLFHCCSCNLLRNSLLMFSRITLLILPISFFAGLMSLAVALFSNCGLWSFNLMKHSSLWNKLRAATRTNKKRRFQYYPTRKKITSLQQGNPVAKERHQPFWCSNGSLRWGWGLWTCGLVSFK